MPTRGRTKQLKRPPRAKGMAIVVCLLQSRRGDYNDDYDDGFWFPSLVKYSSNFPIEIIKQFAFHLKIALK